MGLNMGNRLYDLMDWPSIEGVVYSECDEPMELLGGRICKDGFLIQTFAPDAVEMNVRVDGRKKLYPMEKMDEAGFFAVRRGFEVYPREGKSARAALIGERQRNGRRWVGSEACFSVLPSLCWRWYAPPDERRTSADPCLPCPLPRNPRFPIPGTKKRGRCTPHYLPVGGQSQLG